MRAFRPASPPHCRPEFEYDELHGSPRLTVHLVVRGRPKGGDNGAAGWHFAPNAGPNYPPQKKEDGSSGMDSLMNTPTSTTGEFDALRSCSHVCMRKQTRPGLLLRVTQMVPVGSEEWGDIFLEAERRIEEVRLRRAPRFCPEGPRWRIARRRSASFASASRPPAKIAIRPELRAEIVHIADMASWPLGCGGPARLRSRRTKVALSAHGTDIAFPDRNGVLPFLYGLYMRLGGHLARNCRVLANSQATETKVRLKLNLKPAFGFRSTGKFIPLATDLPKPPLDLRSRERRERSVLFAGRLLPRKGCRWFIENVLPNLPADVHLDVAGTIWDEKEKDALTSSRVRYLGALGWEDLRLAYANADCVVVPNIPCGPSDFEGFGLVAVEAAAAGGRRIGCSSHWTRGRCAARRDRDEAPTRRRPPHGWRLCKMFSTGRMTGAVRF